jgi:hypothetical protein
MTEPCGINVLLDLHMGVRVDFHKEKPVIFCQSLTIYSARPQERPMRTHRFGRKIKLNFLRQSPSNNQIRMRMAQYEIKKAEAEARAEVLRGQTDDNPSMSSSSVTTP